VIATISLPSPSINVFTRDESCVPAITGVAFPENTATLPSRSAKIMTILAAILTAIGRTSDIPPFLESPLYSTSGYSELQSSLEGWQHYAFQWFFPWGNSAYTRGIRRMEWGDRGGEYSYLVNVAIH
jgi:hypothetical protein